MIIDSVETHIDGQKEGCLIQGSSCLVIMVSIVLEVREVIAIGR